MWNHRPTAGELLEDRVRAGWEPVATGMQAGARVLGYACSIKRPGA